jgi:hypothetical protein
MSKRKWSCSVCTFVNNGFLTTCEMCENHKHSSLQNESQTATAQEASSVLTQSIVEQPDEDPDPIRRRSSFTAFVGTKTTASSSSSSSSSPSSSPPFHTNISREELTEYRNQKALASLSSPASSAAKRLKMLSDGLTGFNKTAPQTGAGHFYVYMSLVWSLFC